MAFLWGLLCVLQHTHTVSSVRHACRTKPNRASTQAYSTHSTLCLWSHKINSDYRAFNSLCVALHSVAADRFDTFLAWSRRLSRKNDTEKKTQDQFTGIATNFLCRIASAHRADDHWLNYTLWMKCCDGMTHTDTSGRALTHKQIVAAQSQTDAAITNESKSN